MSDFRESSSEHIREVSVRLRKIADQYTDRFHPDISYLLAGANYVAILADREAIPIIDTVDQMGGGAAAIAVAGHPNAEVRESRAASPMPRESR